MLYRLYPTKEQYIILILITQISRPTYLKAFNILVSSRFLVQDKGNNFTFYPSRFAISNEEMLGYVEDYIQYDYWKQKNKPFENEYSQTYYDGGYRYPDPPWKIAGSPEELNVEVEDNSYHAMNLKNNILI